MELKKKITLKTKGDAASLNGTKLQVITRWKTAVDLDAHVFAIDKDGRHTHVYYGNKNAPGIQHHGDEGVGGRVDHADGNCEVIDVDLSQYRDVIVAMNIFSNAQNFAEIGAGCRVTCGDQEIEVDMDEKNKAKWCTIAHITNQGIAPSMKKLDVVTKEKPDIQKAISGTLASDADKGGFLGGFFR